MPQRFIIAGPIDGLYHVLYKIPGSSVYSSVGCAESEDLAHEECQLLNDQQAAHDDQKWRIV